MTHHTPTPADLAFDRSNLVKAEHPHLIAPGVQRILADNPSALTFTGTNTYLIGASALAVIDPGPDSEGHRAAILAAAGGRPITHIFLTHTHRDHSAGMAKLAALTGALTCAYGPVVGPDAERRAVAASNERTRGFFEAGSPPGHILRDGDSVAGGDWQIEALHTPGHAPDHVCYALNGTGVLFSGDHVMGWNTSVIAPPEGHMGDYIAALERLLTRADTLYLSGHGEPIREPQKLVRAYLVHRQMRELAVLEAVREGLQSVMAIRDRVYKGLADGVLIAASLSTLAHLESLTERGLVEAKGGVRLDGQFSPRS